MEMGRRGPIASCVGHWLATPHLPAREDTVARRKGPRSTSRLRKDTLNGLAIEVASVPDPDAIVGVKVQAASRPPYDYPTVLQSQVQQPTVTDLLCCKWVPNRRTVGAKPFNNRLCQCTPTPHLLTQEAPVARRQRPESVYLLVKCTPNGRATEAATVSGTDTKVGVIIQAASRPAYDHSTAVKPHVQEPAVAALLGCKLDA